MPQPTPVDLNHARTYARTHAATHTHICTHTHMQRPRSNPNIMSALSAFFYGPAKTKVLTLEEWGGVSIDFCGCVCVLPKKPDQSVDTLREWKCKAVKGLLHKLFPLLTYQTSSYHTHSIKNTRKNVTKKKEILDSSEGQQFTECKLHKHKILILCAFRSKYILTIPSS